MTKRKPKSEHKPNWRPTKKDKQKVKKLEEAFALDCSIPEACFYAWISKQTYYNWIEKDPKLLDRFEELRNNPILIARQTLAKWCETDPNLALKYLERKRKKEFWQKIETWVTDSDWNDVLPVSFVWMTKAQLNKIKKDNARDKKN